MGRMHQGVGIILIHHATSPARLMIEALGPFALPAELDGGKMFMNRWQSSLEALKAFGEARR